MKQRNISGATLGLAVALMVTIILLGIGLFYLTRIMGGGKQCANATDAGALTAARSMLAVGVPKTSVAPEFQGLGIDPHTGKPDPVNGLLNIFAYNRACGAAALIAMNAVEANTPEGLRNAEGLIKHQAGGSPALDDFGDSLNAAILKAGEFGGKVADDFEHTASQNNINMMGKKAATHLIEALQFQSVETGLINPITKKQDPGKSNVYFNNNLSLDKNLMAMAAPLQDTLGQTKSVAFPDANAVAYEKNDPYQSGQFLLKAYQPINVIPGNQFPIYLAAVNPPGQPHLISSERFAGGAQRFGNAPVNSVQGKILTTGTNEANTNISATACAVVGALFNEYPIVLNHGYVRVHNLPDARVANPNLVGFVDTVNDSNNIFNNALYMSPPGGGGVYAFNNGVFTTRFAPGGLAEALAYAAYNASAKGAGPKDYNGRNPLLDPADGKGQPAAVQAQYAQQYRQSSFAGNAYYPPNAQGSLRFGASYGQKAQLADLLGINGSATTFCTTYMYDQVNTPDACNKGLPTWAANYDNHSSGKQAASGQYTNLEAAKAEVLTALNLCVETDDTTWRVFSIAGQFKNPSGSKVYQRTGKAYATPTNVPTCAFGKVGTPYELIAQLDKNGATTVNLNDPAQWRNPNTILGSMLIRCKEICPSADWDIIRDLLKAHPLPLDAYQYIYSPDGGLTLTISTSPPAFLNGLSEYTKPGSTIPDGKLFPNADDKAFQEKFNKQDPIIGNIVDAAMSVDGNTLGDGGLNAQPFGIHTGQLSTYDFTNFQTSSGRYDLLGQLEFGNMVTGSATFKAPN